MTTCNTNTPAGPCGLHIGHVGDCLHVSGQCGGHCNTGYDNGGLPAGVRRLREPGPKLPVEQPLAEWERELLAGQALAPAVPLLDAPHFTPPSFEPDPKFDTTGQMIGRACGLYLLTLAAGLACAVATAGAVWAVLWAWQVIG